MRWDWLIAALVCGPGYAQQDPAAACLHSLADDDRFAVLAGRLALADAHPGTPGVLADRSVPGPLESRAIADWVDARGACIASGAQFRQQHYPPQLRAIEHAAEARLATAAAALADRRLDFAGFNARRLEIEEDVASRWTAAVRDLRQQRQMSGQGQRQAEWLARQQSGQQARQREQEAALAAGRRDADRRQAANAQMEQARAVAAQSRSRDALARRQASAQQLLNGTYPPYQYPVPPPVPLPSGSNCHPAAVTWICTSR